MKIAIILGLTTLLAGSYAQRFVCYYGSWSVYRPGPAKFEVSDIDPTLCTHLVFSFVGLKDDGTVRILDPYNDVGDDWHEGAFSKMQKLRARNPDIKILCGFGGWNEGSVRYSKVVNNPSLRKVLTQSILAFTLEHRFDGFDLDWEYPNQRGGVPSDREAFSSLIAELRALFDGHNLILSAAVSANALLSPGSYNSKDLAKYLDFVSIMTYDFRGGWDRFTGHHTAMYPHPSDPAGEKHLNLDTAIRYWVESTNNPGKLNIGLASYARTFTLADANRHGVRSVATGPGPAGSYIPEQGFLGFHEFCMQKKKGLLQVYEIPEQDVKYAVRGNVWIGFDDVDTIGRKMEYARKMSLGGAMIWSIDTDDFRGDCGMGKYPLLRKVNEMLKLPTTNMTSPPTPTTTTRPSTTTTTGRPTPSTTSTPPPCTSTSSPPQVDDLDKMCRSVTDIFTHPKNASMFCMCVYSGVGSTLKAVCLKCPAGLVFNGTTKVCDYPRAL